MQNQNELDTETRAIYNRIQNIKSMINQSESEENDIFSLEGETEINDEYKEFILDYIETIKNQITENHEEFEQIYRLKMILEQNVEKLSDSLNVARKQIERQNIKLSSMSNSKIEFENQEKKFELILRDYQSQIREFKKKLTELEKKISEITTKNSVLAQEISEVNTRNVTIQQEKEQLEKEYFNLNEKLIGVEQALENKKKEYQRIYDRIQIIEEQIQSNEDNTDDLLQENLDLGEGIIEMEKSLTHMKEAIFKLIDFIKPDLPNRSIYKILFCLIENKKVKVKEFHTLTNITAMKAYIDVKELEDMGFVYIDRQSARNYQNFIVSLILSDM